VFQIKFEKLLNQFLKKMKKYHFELSDRKNKKYKVWNDEIGWIHFGDKRYEHYKTNKAISSTLPSYSEHLDEERRRKYRARASKITDKAGNYTYLDDKSPNFYSYNFLW
jgi:hypothetical protein